MVRRELVLTIDIDSDDTLQRVIRDLNEDAFYAGIIGSEMEAGCATIRIINARQLP